MEPESPSLSRDVLELNSLLERAAERLETREREIASLESRLRSERERSERLERELKEKEDARLELVREKSKLEQQVRHLQDAHEQERRKLQRAAADSQGQVEQLQGRLREHEGQQVEFQKAKWQLEQSLAQHSQQFLEQVHQNRDELKGLYEVTQKFYAQLHQAHQAQEGSLNKLQESLSRHQAELQRTAVGLEQMSERLMIRLDALSDLLKERARELAEEIQRVSGQVEGSRAQMTALTEGKGLLLQSSVEDVSGMVRSALGQLSTVQEVLAVFQKDRKGKGRLSLAIGEEFYSEMMFGISHQLKNPLGVIRSNAQLCLKSVKGKSKEHALLESIVASCDRMQDRLTEFVELTKPIQYVMAPADLTAVVDEALTAVQVRLDSQKVQVVKAYQQVAPVTMDAQRIQQAVLHGLVNALDAMPQGGTLTLRIREEGGWAVVTMSDNGVGMSVQDLAQAWQPFYSTKEHHLGLGLVVVRHAVVSHHGTVELQSQEGAGTTLEIRLPLSQEAT